jgi:hypothetical protein
MAELAPPLTLGSLGISLHPATEFHVATFSIWWSHSVGFELISKEDIPSHTATLEILILGADQSLTPFYYSVRDMNDIFKVCKKLKYIAVKMPTVYLGSLAELGSDFRLGKDRFSAKHTLTEFEQMLLSTPSNTACCQLWANVARV